MCNVGRERPKNFPSNRRGLVLCLGGRYCSKSLAIYGGKLALVYRIVNLCVDVTNARAPTPGRSVPETEIFYPVVERSRAHQCDRCPTPTLAGDVRPIQAPVPVRR